MDYEKLSTTILKYVGGEENVANVTHCATRLRFNLKDDTKADTNALENVDGIVSVVNKGGQYQVVIGSDVPSVYQKLIKHLNQDEMTTTSVKKGNYWDRFVDTVSGIFTPILPPLTASGMLKAVLALLVAFKWVSKDSSTYQVVNFMADATFYFLPILLADSAAKKFGCNRYLAMMLGGILVHPNFISMVTAAKQAGTMVSVFGLPIYNATYSSSVIPIILGVWFMSKVEPIAQKYSPKAIKYFTAPLITMFVTGIVTLCVLGPVGYIVSTWIAAAVNGLNAVAGWLVPTIMGLVLPLLVMTGTHHALTPIGINNRMTIGYDTIIYPGQLASNVAQGAAALAVSVKTKDSNLKQLSSATGITAVCGITEPVLFGVTMKIRTCLIATMAGGAAGGFFLGINGIKNFTGGAPGLLTLPSYISSDYPMSNFYLACVGAAIAFVVAFVISFILYKDKPAETADSSKGVSEKANTFGSKTAELYSPMNGTAVELKDVNDPTFANELMGKGIAVKPSEGKLYAPANGVIKTVFTTKHAITMTTDDGVDIIMHVGIDTVKLDGKYFTAKVKDGDTVEAHELLLEFDKDAIEKEGFDLITPVVVANSQDYSITSNPKGNVSLNDVVIQVKGKQA